MSKPGKEPLKFPYLLRGVEINRADQVWAADITYIRLAGGFIYLLAIMDWHSRFVIEIEVSNTLEAGVFVETLKRALDKGRPEIFNTDQGSQFTALDWLRVLEQNRVQSVWMDAVVVSIIFLSSVYGGQSNKKKFI